MLIFLFVFNASFSQVMNWEDGTIRIPKKENDNDKLQNGVDYGTFSSFMIKDINLFLWKVTISGNRVDLETPIPTELQVLFRLPSKQLAATTNNEEVATAVAETETQAEKLEAIMNKKVSLNKTRGIKTEDELETALLKLSDESKTYLRKTQIVSNDIQQTKQARVGLINLAQRDLSRKEMVAEVEGIDIPADLSGDLKAMFDAYKKVQAAYDKVLKFDLNDEVEEGVRKAMTSIDQALKTIEDEYPSILYGDVTFLAAELKNKKNFEAIAPPVQADGDFVNYKVTIVPTQTNTLGAHKSSKSFDFDIPVRGGWKTDFSVGPTFSLGGNAKDEKYFFEPGTVEGNAILKKRDNNNDLSPGLAAMMHFYKRSGNDISWGGMLGVGAGFQSVEDVDVSFFTGLSCILGKKQKIMLSAGASFLKVERLKTKEYKTDSEYVMADVTLNDITEKVFRTSFFMSLSYNLTNRSEH